MKRWTKLLLTVAALAAAASLATAQSKGDGGIKGLDEAWKKAMLANDVDAVVACYADQAVTYMPDGRDQKGREAIRASYVEWLGPHQITAVAFSDFSEETSGNLACSWGKVTVTMTPKAGGDPMTLQARFTSVAKRSGGKWLYVVDHASHVLAPAAEPAKN